MAHRLPPGPRLPKAVQTLGWWTRTGPWFERCRARYGKRFTIRLLSSPPFVHLSDPDEVKEVFTAPPEVLHPGEGARILEPIVGPNSVILLDEGAHLSQRKLMLPAFHGERMERLTGLMDEVAEREVASWPREERVVAPPPAPGPDAGDHPAGGLRPRSRARGSMRCASGSPASSRSGASPASMLPFLRRGRSWSAFERSATRRTRCCSS